MKKLLSKKSQSSVEFIILITFMMVVFTLVAVFVQKRIVDVHDEKTRDSVDQLKNIVFNELEIAESMPVNYSREFYLPPYLVGSDYTIDVDKGVELIINFRGEAYVYFFPIDMNLLSNLNVGINIITKLRVGNQIEYGFNI